MLKVTKALTRMFEVPRVYFTVKGNPISEKALARLQARLQAHDFITSCKPDYFPQECLVFENEAQVKTLFESGISRDSAVAIFDSNMTAKRFTFTTIVRPKNDIPRWAHGAHWGVKIGQSCDMDNGLRNCAEQLAAHFNRNFQNRLFRGEFPWGSPKRGENPPVHVNVPEETRELTKRLNQGPDLAAAIADKECALELPKDSRISWYRIPNDPLQCDLGDLTQILKAFSEFEVASSKLVNASTEVQKRLFAGVVVDPKLVSSYLFPSVPEFSVRRPDLHFTGEGVFASENDEMPGGFAELCFLDFAMGINQERWERCFEWLTAKGRLLFVVSHDWSKCYIPEMTWLTSYMKSKGFDVDLVTTDHLDALQVTNEGVFDSTGKIGTIWRQFPIFEATGKLVDLVLASQEDRVRMIPEFAHFGNKVWFSLFRSHHAFFREALDPDTLELLDQVLPDSHLVQSAHDFPMRVDGVSVSSLEELMKLPPEKRDALVMKVSGANPFSARSYGVLMGHGLTQQTWESWIWDKLSDQRPFIVQRRLETGVVQMPVFNTKLDRGELFNCRVLLRPWMVGGEIVSVHSCAVPSNTLRNHGRVDMAVAPVVFV